MGMDPAIGRPKIAVEVLDEMRHYLVAAEGPERLIRKERVRISIDSLSNDPLGQKTLLRLEPAPWVSTDLNKGKCIVFNFEKNEMEKKTDTQKLENQKLISSAIRSGNAMSRLPMAENTASEVCSANFGDNVPLH